MLQTAKQNSDCSYLPPTILGSNPLKAQTLYPGYVSWGGLLLRGERIFCFMTPCFCIGQREVVRPSSRVGTIHRLIRPVSFPCNLFRYFFKLKGMMGIAETRKAMADPQRRNILILLKVGCLSAGKITAHLGDLSAVTVSFPMV